jgi:hypothetical protein
LAQLIDDMASAQAAGICSLARMKGLPESIPNLRSSVVQLHPEGGCAWCEYPVKELAEMCGTVTANGVMIGVSERNERLWWAMPGKARLAAIKRAQTPDPW